MRDEEKRVFVCRIIFRKFGRVGRIKVPANGRKIKAENQGWWKIVEAVSLLNSGYEAPTPQLLIPVDLARRLDLWPPPSRLGSDVGYCGWSSKSLDLSGSGKDKRPNRGCWIKGGADIIVSPLADEPLINDKLADELEIAVESFGRGIVEIQLGAQGKTEEKRKQIAKHRAILFHLYSLWI